MYTSAKADVTWVALVLGRVFANSADPDQTAPEGAVWPGPTLFAIPFPIFYASLLCESKLLHLLDNYGS